MNRTSKRDDRAPRKGTQQSVAELLARYGEPSSGGRRHRRRATDTDGAGSKGTAPKSIISRVESDGGTRPRPVQPSYLRVADPDLAPTPLPGAGRPQRGEPPAGLAARPGGSVATLAPGAAAPPASVPPASVPGPAAVPGSAESHDQQAGYDGEESENDLSSAREWAVVAGQVGVGVVGGAVLWLVCEWLWQSIPVLALVVALLVITSLVWVVRYVRRTEDLQTTVIAVLVGLFVTVSPAALLLVGR